MKKLLLLIVLISCILNTKAQGVLRDIYPIGESANVGYKTSMVPSIEKILFEANPIVRLALLNTIQEDLENNKNKTSALYLNFKPQIRMYHDNSKPVRMPSYNIGLAFQQVRRLKDIENALLAFSLESGHYSNGQDRSAFDANLEDGSPAAEAKYDFIEENSDLSTMINRYSGNFSTNFTEFNVKYIKAVGELTGNYKPRSSFSVQFGYNRFHDRLLWVLHDIGGYTENDIKIYGKNRFKLGGDFMKMFDKAEDEMSNWSLDRYQVALNFNFIHKPHPHVNPFRTDLTGTVYLHSNLGFFISGIYGHDNYNYRFVDSGFQLFTGLVFDPFPRVQWKR